MSETISNTVMLTPDEYGDLCKWRLRYAELDREYKALEDRIDELLKQQREAIINKIKAVEDKYTTTGLIQIFDVIDAIESARIDK